MERISRGVSKVDPPQFLRPGDVRDSAGLVLQAAANCAGVW